MRVEEALERYETQLAGDGRSEHTVKQARRHVRAFAAWLEAQGRDGDIAVVTHELVASYLASDAVRLRADGQVRLPTSANALRSSLRCFMGFVHAAGYAPTNAARLVRRARTRPPRPKALSEADAAKLVETLQGAVTSIERRDRALILTLMRTGLRIGSAIALDVGDLDFHAGELVVTRLKGGDTDAVVIPDDLVPVLREQVGCRTRGPLFVASHGARVGVRHVRRRLTTWARRAGIGSINPHAMRHALGMLVYRQTRDIMVVAQALSHRCVTSSAAYARASKDAVRSAIGQFQDPTPAMNRHQGGW